MSLDVYLEFNDRPRPCPHCNGTGTVSNPEAVYSANITHNLGRMAKEAGIYEALWRPEEIGITTAAQLIEPLRAGLSLLESDPARFEKFDSWNGWGSYQGFVPFVRNYLSACEQNPDLNVRAWR